MLTATLFLFSVLPLGLLILEILKVYLIFPFKLLCVLTIGITINILILFLSVSIFGFNYTFIISATFFLFAIPLIILVLKYNFFETFTNIKLKLDLQVLLSLLLLLIIITAIFYKSIFISQNSIIAGNRLVWVDWPIHLSFISSFLYGDNYPPQNPMHSGSITTYPFFVEFLSAVIRGLGASLKSSLVIPGAILSFTSILLLYSFGKLLFEKKTVVLVGLFIGLLWGGIGFIYFFQDIIGSAQVLNTLLFPPREYTFYAEKNLWFFSFLISELLPQRAFLLGMPIFITSATLIILGISTGSKTKMLLSGYLAAILPFFHMHSYISILIFSASFIILNFIDITLTKNAVAVKKYIYNVLAFYLLPIIGLGLIQLPFFLEVSGNAFAPNIGWMKGDENFFIFWLKNTGFFWPLLLFAIFKSKNQLARNVVLSSISLFIVSNIFRFAPWPYDNLKILTYWYLISSFAVGWTLVYLWRKNYLLKFLSAILFVSLIASGVLEIVRVMNTDKTSIILWTKDDIELAKAVIEKTEPSSTILAAAIHNHPVNTLAGRKMVIGFPGNAWSWGFSDWQQREEDVRTIYKGDALKAFSLLKRYNVSYVLISSREKAFEPFVNQSYFAQNFESTAVGTNWQLFKIK